MEQRFTFFLGLNSGRQQVPANCFYDLEAGEAGV